MVFGTGFLPSSPSIAFASATVGDAAAAVVSGTITYTDGISETPFDGWVTASPSDLVITSSTIKVHTSSDGSYRLELPAGTYDVCWGWDHSGQTPIYDMDQAPRCWENRRYTDSTAITLTPGQVLSGIDGTVSAGGTLSGRVGTLQDGEFQPIYTKVKLWRWDDNEADWIQEFYGATLNGSVGGGPFPVGDYVIEFIDETARYDTTYWPGVRYFSDAEHYRMITGVNEIGDVLMGERSIEVIRITGTNRFETAVQLSEVLYPSVPSSGVPVVYVANGLNYPDALAAGPAAVVNGGNVLLTLPWELPEVVRAELIRLHPQRIVVVGGPPSVDANVFAHIANLPFDHVTNRITGSDRFGTSRALARDTFLSGDNPVGAIEAYIATGLNYPDALAAGPIAGLMGSPIILVNGGMSELDQATLQVLDDLGVERVTIVGGPPSVSLGIEAHLADIYGSANRITGLDRFGTAVQLAQHDRLTWGDDAFLATGLNFPDALAGGPVAGAFEAPLLLSRPDCIPLDVLIQVHYSTANRLILLGGPPSLSNRVESLLIC